MLGNAYKDNNRKHTGMTKKKVPNWWNLGIEQKERCNKSRRQYI